MSSSSSTPPDEYTAEEKAWLKEHYGGEFRFLRSNALNITKDEQREEGRAIARALIDMDKEDELNRSREQQSSRPANPGQYTHQGPADHTGESGYLGFRVSRRPYSNGRHGSPDQNRRFVSSQDPNYTDYTYRQTHMQYHNSRNNAGASGNQRDSSGDGRGQTHESGTCSSEDSDSDDSSDTGSDQSSYDEDEDGHGDDYYYDDYHNHDDDDDDDYDDGGDDDDDYSWDNDDD
ncbi:hypothetical protein V8F20_005302 [Naviculisporaceae sp. PSN 640]